MVENKADSSNLKKYLLYLSIPGEKETISAQLMFNSC